MLDWVGKATVLALGGEVLAACGRPPGIGDSGLDGGTDADGLGSGADADDVFDGGDGGHEAGFDGAVDGGGDSDLESGGLQFAPPDDPPEIFASWPERTVDRQQLEEILRDWRLEVGGMVDREISLTFPDLLELTRLDLTMDFHCVEGWSVYDVPWNGVHLSTILELVGADAAATHLSFLTVDRQYNESLPIGVALEPHTMLAYGVDGSTLPLGHGFPARMVIPRLFGYKSAKYVDRIEVTDGSIAGFWVAAGYPYLGEVPAGRLREGRY